MKETLANLKRVYQFGKEWNKALFLSCFFSFAFVVVHIVYPVFTARQMTALTGGIAKQLFFASLVICGFDMLGALRMFIIRHNTQVYFRGTFKTLQLTCARRILGIRIKDFDDNTSGVFIQRINNDCAEMAHVFTVGTGNLTGIVSSLGVFVAVLVTNWQTFIFYAAASTLITMLHLRRAKKVTGKDKLVRKSQENNTGLVSELVRGVRDIKMLYAAKPFVKAIEKSIAKVTERIYDMRGEEMKFDLIIGCVTAAVELALICLLIWLFTTGTVSVGVAVVLFSYKTKVMTNFIEKVGSFVALLKSFNLAASRVYSLLEDDEFIKEKFGDKHLNEVSGAFEFKDVEFGYSEEKKVLDGISFKVEPNENVAFVGKSGVGKTTLFNLLSRLYDVKNGSIMIDGVDVRELDEESVRSHVTTISQNPYIFHMSIRENLCLVKDDLTEEEMRNACRLACIDDYIMSLPEGYDTVVGEGGYTLSGGQRQRLAIARAFIRKSEIILFDEATSALDNDTQSKIQQAIDNLKKDSTILMIAHRLSTVIGCDRIYFIDEGRVADCGSHNELIERCEAYRNLYESEMTA